MKENICRLSFFLYCVCWFWFCCFFGKHVVLPPELPTGTTGVCHHTQVTQSRLLLELASIEEPSLMKAEAFDLKRKPSENLA